MCGVTARRTSELGLADTVVRSAVPASGARTGRAGRVHRDQLSTGAFSLVGQDRQEHPPARVENAPVQSGLGGRAVGKEPVRVRFGPGTAGHVRDLECFVHDHVVVSHQRVRGLVRVVESLTADLRVQSRDARHGPAAAPGSPFLAGEPPLGRREPIGARREVARVGDMIAVAGRQQPGDSQVDADHGPGRGQPRGGDVIPGQDDEPAVAPPFDTDRLHRSDHGPVAMHADVADALQPHIGRVRMFGLRVRPAPPTRSMIPRDQYSTTHLPSLGDRRQRSRSKR